MSKRSIILYSSDQSFASILIDYLPIADYTVNQVSTWDDFVHAYQNKTAYSVLIDHELEHDLSFLLSKYIPYVFLTNTKNNAMSIEQKTSTFYKKDNFDQLQLLIELAYHRNTSEFERIKMLDNLDETLEIYRQIIESSREAIFFINEDGKIRYWNKPAEKLFAYDSMEAMDNYIQKMILPEEDQANFLESLHSLKGIDNSEFVPDFHELYVHDKHKKTFPITMYLDVIDLQGKMVVSCIAMDMTEIKQTEQEMEMLLEEMEVSRDVIETNANEVIQLNGQLEESQILLKELNDSKDSFFSIIAHDLKGPFQGFLGYSQILSDEIDMLSQEEISEYAKDMNKSATQLFKLLENLLDWSRIQRGVIQYSPENFDLQQIVNMNIDLLEPRFAMKQMHVHNHINKTNFVFADLNMINTIIRNLLSNSLKFTEIAGKIGVKCTNLDDNLIEVCIFDNGVGMSAETQEKIFKIDEHHSTLGTDNERGTGLGLILCKELIEKNGGSIRVSSNEGQGSQFFFTVQQGDNLDLNSMEI